ncbi:hypothetical protein CSTERTH_01090 [Thermoclostridium stercorarium subsp. thermolacticum DSM 2910]|uniref:Uncharacterized protein n=2 Tax=Thermoclostridium stercorarium TaxID=1510 RepID=A0A1B1YAC2_THEST|nr:hypothetical protein CSTERTH_01090 [Thermoclostridium stercorarium subsp. thermolacticum DSM 2910]
MGKYGIPITLDTERHMIFNLNVLEACIEKYQNMDDILNAFCNIKAAKEIGLLMINEATEMWNEDHPDAKKPLLKDEKHLGRLLAGMAKINEFMEKVRQAMLEGLPQEAVQEVEEIEKNLMAAAQKKTTGPKNQGQK